MCVNKILTVLIQKLHQFFRQHPYWRIRKIDHNLLSKPEKTRLSYYISCRIIPFLHSKDIKKVCHREWKNRSQRDGAINLQISDISRCGILGRGWLPLNNLHVNIRSCIVGRDDSSLFQ